MSPGVRVWIRLVSLLVPADDRPDWLEEWSAELTVGRGSMTNAWGALSDAWHLRTEGWTVDGVWRDVRTGGRALLRRPAFTWIAGLTLAIGIGANTAIFSVVDGVLLNPLPFPESERLVSYNHEAPLLGVNVPVIPHSQDMYLHYLDGARELESVAVYSDDNVNLITDGTPIRVQALDVSQPYFEVLGIQPFLGRAFTEGEDRPGAEPVAILGHGLWRRTFGEDRSVLGQLVEMDGVQRRVVGIMPERATFTDEEIWLPLVIDPESPDAGSLGLIGVARLADGATVETANREMQALLERYAEENVDELPTSFFEQAGLAADVQPLRDIFVQDVRQALWVLLGTVGFVLLIACANVANLFLVRAEGRQREMAVRTAMGASRLDALRQHLSEALLLAFGAGIVGLGLASLGVRGLLRFAPAQLPSAFQIGLDGSVLFFTAAVSLLTGIAFGLFPVLGYGRRDLSGSLRDGGRGATGGRERHRLRSGLVVTQVALALVLLVGSGLMFRSFQELRDVDLGFEPENRLTFRIGLPRAEYGTPEDVLDFFRRLDERMAALPGVETVGMIQGLPLTGSKQAGPMESVDQPFPEGQLAPTIERKQVSPGYFEAMGIDLLAGRTLEWSDQADQFRGAVISASLARAFWPDESAVGRRIRTQGSTDNEWEVVGVVADVRFDEVQAEPLPIVYMPILSGSAESPTSAAGANVVLQTSVAPLALLDGVREALRVVDPRLPMIEPQTVEAVVDDSMSATSFTVVLLGIAAGIALLLGTVGIYGVISYIVSRRTQEIGVRMALGAPASTVLRQVMSEGLGLTVVGIVVGLVGAWGMSRALTSLLYGVSATDPITFAATPLLLALVAVLATWLPARRAARVDPVEALRSE